MKDETAPQYDDGPASRRGRKAVLIMAGIVALGLIAGCGKKSSPEAPGPNPTYPKTYPTS